MIPTKQISRHVAVFVQEIVEDVLEAYELGITLVHLHARDEATGAPSQSADVYGRIIAGIRRHAPELVLGVSLSGRNVTTFE